MLDERRQVSALFYDVVESTQLMFSQGVEWYRANARRLHLTARTIIRQYGGFAEQPGGDGGAAFFGFHGAQEDSAERALCAALDILDWIRRQQAASAEARQQCIRVRLAVATGTVLTEAGSESGESLPELFGIVPVLAARLQSHAEPDSILVSEDTYRLTAGLFSLDAVGDILLKGFPEPVRAWRASGRKAATSRFEALRSPLVPMLGRGPEMAAALEAWRSAQAGRGRTLVIRGEAGIGKSRLLLELRNELATQATVLPVLQCQAHQSGIPLHPLRERLADIAALPAFGPDEGAKAPHPAIERLRRALELAAPEEARGSLSDSLRSAQSRGRAILAASTQLVAALAAQGPVLLCVEDSHWADPTTRAWLEHLQTWLADQPVLLAVTTRRHPANGFRLNGNTTVIELEALAADVIEGIAAHHWPSGEGPPRAILDHIRSYSDGVPLFAEEVAKLLARSSSAPGPWVVDQLITLRDMLRARVEQSGAEPRVVQAATVLGRTFRPDVLKRMLKDQVEAAQVDASLNILLTSGLVHVKRVEPSVEYAFNHLLIQEAVYQSIPDSARTSLHQLAFLMLREVHPHASVPNAVLAEHAVKGGLVERGIFYLERAGDDALREGGLREARRHFEAALELIGKSDRASPGGDSPELQVRVKLGALLSTLEGPGAPATRAFYEASVARFEEAQPARPEDWFALCWGWWFTAKDWHEQWHRAQALRTRTRTQRSAAVRLHALHCSWATSFNCGQHREVLAATGKGLALYERDLGGDPQLAFSGHDARLCGLGERALSFCLMGAQAQAEIELEAAKAHLKHLSHLGSQAHLLDMEACLRFFARDPTALELVARRMRGLSRAHGLPALAAKARIFSGWSRAALGAPAAGEARIREGLDRLAEIGTEEDFPLYADMLAQALTAQARWEEAFAVLDDAAARAERTGHAFWLAELFRRRAMTRHRLDPGGPGWRGDLRAAARLARAQAAYALLRRVMESEAELAPGRASTLAQRRTALEAQIARLQLRIGPKA